jgi:hypothetical protein
MWTASTAITAPWAKLDTTLRSRSGCDSPMDYVLPFSRKNAKREIEAEHHVIAVVRLIHFPQRHRQRANENSNPTNTKTTFSTRSRFIVPSC